MLERKNSEQINLMSILAKFTVSEEEKKLLIENMHQGLKSIYGEGALPAYNNQDPRMQEEFFYMAVFYSCTPQELNYIYDHDRDSGLHEFFPFLGKAIKKYPKLFDKEGFRHSETAVEERIKKFDEWENPKK
jgi:hypothetical protein